MIDLINNLNIIPTQVLIITISVIALFLLGVNHFQEKTIKKLEQELLSYSVVKNNLNTLDKIIDMYEGKNELPHRTAQIEDPYRRQNFLAKYPKYIYLILPSKRNHG